MSSRSMAMSTSNDFKKFWLGQAISSLGSSFTGFALPLLIYKLTGSALNLAFSAATGLVPYLLFGLVIGAWVDRVNRKRLMVFTDILRALVIASIPCLALLGLLSVWWIYVATFINATLTICFDAANFAAIPSLVSRDELVTANGRIQASYSAAGIAGPLLAGLFLAVLPLPTLLFVDALSFLVSASSLVLVHTSFNVASDEKKVPQGIYQDIREGLLYVVQHKVLRWITLLLLFSNFIGPTADIQIVLFAKQWLRASDTQVGVLLSSASVSVVLFSLLAGRLRKHLSFNKIILGSDMGIALLTIASALTHEYWLALFFWSLRAGAKVLFNINGFSFSQRIVPNHLLGRVIISTRVLTWSTASLGALLGGFAVEQTKNVGLVYSIVGALSFSVTLLFLFTPLGRAERYVVQEE